jgi:hypothetical protein
MKKFIVNQECGSLKPQVKNGASPKSQTSRNNPLTSEKGTDTKQFFMKKAVFVVIMAMAFGAGIFTACQKDSLVPNESHTAIKKQKWNPDKGYPFVLPEADMPYQYAIYEDDFSKLQAYIRSVFDSHKDGEKAEYFILSLSADKTFINYGFVYGTLDYNLDDFIDFSDPDIDPDPDPDEGDEDGGTVCFAKVRDRCFTDKEKFDRWVERKVNKGWMVSEWKSDGFYCAHARKD